MEGILYMKNLRIITFNIRRDRGDDGINNWEYRRELVASILKEHNPDIAVFQEVLVHQLEDLQQMLPEYQYVGVGRDDGLEDGEFAPIFYRGLSVEKQGTFWLSETPDTPSCTWPGMTRICTWASFSGESPFVLFNTHFEYEFDSTQIKSIGLLKERTGIYSEDFPILLTGDFNLNPDTGPYQNLSGFFKDSFTGDKDSPSTTNHEWNGRTEQVSGKSNRIDYVWNRGNLQVKECRILIDNPSTEQGVYPSDHWPVLCDVQIP
jgi:endonuclease/exonuclease/phosphatase family metal-dependent hydrolase